MLEIDLISVSYFLEFSVASSGKIISTPIVSTNTVSQTPSTNISNISAPFQSPKGTVPIPALTVQAQKVLFLEIDSMIYHIISYF